MYFIYDCNFDIVGNINGYATYKGASRQAEFGFASNQIYKAFNLKYLNIAPTAQNRILYKISMK